MDATTFERIKTKIESLKTRKSKAEGAMESIIAQWKKEFNISTVEDAQALLVKMEEEKDALETELEDYNKELMGITNWSLV